MFCPPVYNAIAHIYDKLPILDLKNRVGYTDYIDFIEVKDMPYSIMKGSDIYNRPFVAFKVKTFDTHTNETDEIVGTFFQRYTYDYTTYAYGTCYKLNMIHYDARVRLDQYDNLELRLKLLVDGQIINAIDLNISSDIELNFIRGNSHIEIKL